MHGRKPGITVLFAQPAAVWLCIIALPGIGCYMVVRKPFAGVTGAPFRYGLRTFFFILYAHTVFAWLFGD
jgi:hypothetical protein